MCEHCYRGNCWRCTGCWHETEHDFSDRYDYADEGHAIDMAERSYDRFYDRMFGDAA